MKHLTAFTLMLMFALPAASHAAPPNFVPANDPGFQNADTLQKAGVVLGGPEGTYSRRPPGRREFAAAIVKLMHHISSDHAQENQLAASPPALTALNALVAEFTPELTAMKENVTQYQSTLAALAARHPLVDHPFSDVPPDHWAAAAVETLRQRGIVKGYPAGAYRTK